MNNIYYYRDKPIFGLDIGFNSIKVMQINYVKNQRIVTGYGVIDFNEKAVVDGVIVDPIPLAHALADLFKNKLVGTIKTKRAAISIPATKAYTRTMTLPIMNEKDIAEAVKLEAEQYIPVPIDNLYLDYSIIKRDKKQMELLAVAIPKKIIDSYMKLAELIDIEVVAIESSINSTGRLFLQAERNDIPTVIIDFGSISSDVTVYDKTLVVTGTVPGGGNNFTQLIAKALGVSDEEAITIKNKYGLNVSKKQPEIISSLQPLLEEHIKEIKRMIRYYDQRSQGSAKISQILTMGGGANMPGLSEYMTDQLRIAVRTCDPWQHLVSHDIQPPTSNEKSLYATVAGLALTNSKEIFG